jgi:hypothetical protein
MRRTILLLSTMALALLLTSGVALAAVPAPSCESSGSVVACTFDYTGNAQSWTVPEGVTQATFDVYGAQGGSEPLVNILGGGGGMAHATIAVTPGDKLQVNVGGGGSAGGAGGFNGGAGIADPRLAVAP